MAEKKIQIPLTLFLELANYVYEDAPTKAMQLKCQDGVMAQIQRLANNELYHKFKTAKSQEEKEKYLNEWYESKGVPKSFRIL